MDLKTNTFLEHGFALVNSGHFIYEDWARLMIEFIGRHEEETSFTSPELCRVISSYVWHDKYKFNSETHTIEEWANKFLSETKVQKEMRNSIDQLFRAVKDFQSSTFFQDLLTFCASFKDLAPYNAMMVKTQMPSARYVLSKKKWADYYHRAPKRNARPLVILKKYGPVDYVYEIGDTEPITHSSSLFSSTDEEILNQLANPYKTIGKVDTQLFNNLVNALPYYGIKLERFRAAASYAAEILKTECKVIIRDIETNGHYVISVNERADSSVAFASICHELGHYFCRHISAPNDNGVSWWTKRSLSWTSEEFEAEIVSYIICERYGVGNCSWTYLSQVLGEKGTIPDDISIDRIFKAANEVERMLDEKLDPKTCFVYFNNKEFKKEYNKKYPSEKEPEETEFEN